MASSQWQDGIDIALRRSKHDQSFLSRCSWNRPPDQRAFRVASSVERKFEVSVATWVLNISCCSRQLLTVIPVAFRHPNHTVESTTNLPFPASQYPAVEAAIRGGSPSISASDMQFRKNYTDHGSLLHTHNEAGRKVAVAYATPSTTLTDWIVVVERTRSGAYTARQDLIWNTC